jgi:hypothetical protein
VEATVSINSKLWRYAAIAPVLAATIHTAGCTTDDTDPDGKGGSSSAGKGGGGGSGGGGNAMGGSGGQAPAGTVCANPIAIPSTATGIADFDTYDGSKALDAWSFPLNNDTTLNVYGGPFGYGDRANNVAETFDLIDGYGGTMYALTVADTKAENYGGGLGIWLSTCINATAFTGVSFWVRGSAPTGKATLKISMGDTMTSMPATGTKIGTCPGTDKTCIHPMYEFAVTDEWVQIKAPWTGFKAGDAAGTPVIPNGRNIEQFGIDIGLVWAPDAGGVYVPTPAPYELVVDSLAFY